MSGGGLRHPDWYLISEQRFRRRAAVAAIPQSFRGEAYVVLADRLTGQHLRLTRRAARLWEAFDGRRTLAELWQDLSGQRRDAPTQAEMLDWVMQLVSSGLLLSDHMLDPRHLSERGAKRRDQLVSARSANPLAIKIPLFDPQRLIAASYPLVRPLFSAPGALALLLLVLAAILTAAMNWDRITTTSDEALLSQSGLIAMFLSYPLMKALHELSHGWTVHHFGGQVREAGVMLLIFVPVPYVDASAANAFADRRARMLVGAAGVIAELVMAALSLFLWLAIEPGLERAVLFSVMVMGTLSTLFFNGNPLLKFDAYYVLSDWLEMPNLATRASRALAGFVERRLGLRPKEPEQGREAAILLTYALVSLAYRLVISLAIALFVSMLFFALGVALAIWSILLGYVWPLARFLRDAWRRARGQNRQRSLLRRGAIGLGLVLGLGLLIPLPFSAHGQGRFTLSARADLVLTSTGFVQEGAHRDGDRVRKGDVLLMTENPDQQAQLTLRRKSVEALSARLARAAGDVATRRDLIARLALARAALAEAERRDAERALIAPATGRLSWAGGSPPLAGLFGYQGDRLGRILTAEAVEASLALPAGYAGDIAAGDRVELYLPDGQVLTLAIDRFQVLDAGGDLPLALRASQGGPVAENPDSPGKTLTPTLAVTALAPGQDLTARVGQRFEARLPLAPRPLLLQWAFHLRSLFLRVTRF